MIRGYFDQYGRPFVQGRLTVPRLGMDGFVDFLVDTGSDSTVLHPLDGQLLRCNFDLLKDSEVVDGIGGGHDYFPESGAAITLTGERTAYQFSPITIDIAKPGGNVDTLPSILGNDMLQYLKMYYRRRVGTLIFQLDDGR